MKQLQCNFTTSEQSKRLLELGVPADSADCFLTRFGIDKDWKVKVLNNVKYSEIAISNQEYCLPCWSVGRLIELYMKAKGLDFMYFRIMSDADMIDSIIRMFVENQNEIDFSNLEE